MSVTQPGQLDDQITLYSPTIAVDEFGQAVKSWTKYGTIWAHVEEGHGTESVKAGEFIEDRPLAIVIRYDHNIRSSCKLTYGSETYRITSTRTINRAQWTEIKAVQIGEEVGD